MATDWKDILRESYRVMDESARIGLRKCLQDTGKPLACTEGCSPCCTGRIPASAPELAGAYWHLANHCSGKERIEVHRRFQNRPVGECPFLIDHHCSVYPMRFFACRQFLVLETPCAIGEDVWSTRNQDIVRPDADKKNAAIILFSSVYKGDENIKSLPRFISEVSAPIHTWDFSKIRSILRIVENGELRYREGYKP